MKVKVLLLVLSIFSFSDSYAESLDSKEIELSTVSNKGLLRSSQSLPVSAFINNALITIDFAQSITYATASIINIETGESVYSESFSNLEDVFINLSSEKDGKYRIKIATATSIYWGDFTLELN